MAVAPFPSAGRDFIAGLDELLLELCEELQLSSSRHDQAVGRYRAMGEVLDAEGSPFRELGPKIYPQGSMALGTTVKPIKGPHDLDFVLQLALFHHQVDPMRLIHGLYRFLRRHAVYGPMTSLLNRCVRVEYANEFYMDILPACCNAAAGGTCIKVPDRALKSWTDSDPLGYIRWFEDRSKILFVSRMFDRAAPVPAQEDVTRKTTLKLVVQLIKRWRDRYYSDADVAPISIVLTTLAGHAYAGQRSVSETLGAVLSGIIVFIDRAHQSGNRLRVWHPTHPAEDLSESWNHNLEAYSAFEAGIRDFHRRWSQLIARGGNINFELQELFGEPVKTVLTKRAKQYREGLERGRLGVTTSGLVTSIAAANVPIAPHTFYGED